MALALTGTESGTIRPGTVLCSQTPTLRRPRGALPRVTTVVVLLAVTVAAGRWG